MTESKSELVSATEDAPSGRLSTASSQAPVTSVRGWFWPQNSRKAHYFTTHDGYPRALCGGWALFSNMNGNLEDEGHLSPDNCAKCKQARLKMFGPLDDAEESQ